MKLMVAPERERERAEGKEEEGQNLLIVCRFFFVFEEGDREKKGGETRAGPRAMSGPVSH